MMKKLSALLLLTLMACEFGQKTEQTVSADDSPVFQGTFVEYELKDIQERGGACEEDPNSVRCVNVSISYPSILKGAKKAILDSMNSNIRASILEYAFVNERSDDFQKLISEMKNEYRSVTEEFPDYGTSWQLEVRSDIIFQDSLFISVASTIYSYTGGAHANSFQVYRSYDLQTGRQLKLEDLFEKSYVIDLNEAAELEFRMAKQIPPSRDLDQEGYFFNGNRFELNENFSILNKSLLFYFNPYEIAPYALGGTLLELKLTDYVKLIKDESVIQSLKN